MTMIEMLQNTKPVEPNTMAIYETAIEILSELATTLSFLSRTNKNYTELLNKEQEELYKIKRSLDLDKVAEIDTISSKYALILRDYYKVEKDLQETGDPKVIDLWIEKWFVK